MRYNLIGFLVSELYKLVLTDGFCCSAGIWSFLRFVETQKCRDGSLLYVLLLLYPVAADVADTNVDNIHL